MAQAERTAQGWERPLSEPERRVLEAIRRRAPAAASIEEILANTLLPPDVVMRAVALLLQDRRIRVSPEEPSDSALELIAAAS
jgi:hypothetical protein